MDLWVNLDKITRNMEIIEAKNKKLAEKKTPLQRLNKLRAELFSKGVTYTDICYVNDIANELNICTGIRKEDFLDGCNAMYTMRVDGALDIIIPRLEEIYKGK